MASSRPQRSRKGISYRDLAHGKGLKELSEETVHSPNVVKKNNSVGASKKIANVEKLQEKGTITVEDAVRTSQTDQDMAVNTVITITESGSKDADITNDVFEVMAAVISRSFLANIKTRKDRRVKDVISSLGASCVRSKGTYVVHGSEEAVLKVKTGLTWLALEDEMKKSQTATKESETKSTAHESEEISELQDTSHTSEPRDTSLTETENISAMDTVPILDMDCTPAEEIRVIDTKESTSADQISHVTPKGIIGNSREEVPGSEQREEDQQGKDDGLSTTVETDASEALVFKEVPTTEEQQESQSGENRNDKEDIEKKETSDTKSGKSKLRVPKKDKPQSPLTVVEVRLSPRKRKPTERGKTYSKKAKRDSGAKKVHFVGESNADPETQVEVVKDTKGEPVFNEEEEAALVFQDAMPEIILKDPNTNATEENEDTPAASGEPGQEDTNQEDTVLIEIKPEKKSRTPKGKKPGWYIPDTTLCDICGFESSTPKGLYAHLRAYHGKRVRFECKICLRVFTVKNAHKRHVMTHFQKDMHTLTHLAAELHISALEEHKRTVELPPVLQAQLEAYKRGELGVLDPDPEANKVGKDGYVRGRMNREELPKGTIAWEEVPRSEWVPGSEAKIDAAATADVPYDTEVGQEEAENEPKQATQILIQEELQTTEENVAAEDIKPSPEVAEGEEKSKEPDSQDEGTKDKVNVDPQVEGTKDKVNVDPAIADIFEPTEIRQDNDVSQAESSHLDEETSADMLAFITDYPEHETQLNMKKWKGELTEAEFLIVGLLKHPAASKKVVGCPVCLLLFPTNDDLKGHISFAHQYADLTGLQAPEEEVEERFDKSLNDTLYQVGAKTENPDENVEGPQCKLCGTMFSSEHHLKTHILRLHGPDSGDPNKIRRKTKCGKLQCPKCDFFTYRQASLAIHFKVHNKPEFYHCKYCDYKKKKLGEVLHHQRRLHGEMKFQCPHCPQRFRERTVLRVHVKSTHDKAYTRMCETCGAKLNNISHYRLHVEKEHPEVYAAKYPKSICDVCGEEQLSKRALKDHMLKNHKDEFNYSDEVTSVTSGLQFFQVDEVYGCRICPMTDSNVETVRSHIASEHMAERFKCMHCQEIFSRKMYLNKHLREKHLQASDLYCIRCDKSFSSTIALKRHNSRVHEQNERFKCELCDEAFFEKWECQLHMKSVHDTQAPKNVFKCPFSGCSRSFPYKSGLKNHVTIHTGERPFSCTFPNCNQSFRSKHLLTNHLAVHSDTRDFQCPLCSKSYKAKKYLQVHMKFHSKDKHICTYCFQSFSTKRSLNLHECSKLPTFGELTLQNVGNLRQEQYISNIKQEPNVHPEVTPGEVTSQLLTGTTVAVVGLDGTETMVDLSNVNVQMLNEEELNESLQQHGIVTGTSEQQLLVIKQDGEEIDPNELMTTTDAEGNTVTYIQTEVPVEGIPEGGIPQEGIPADEIGIPEDVALQMADNVEEVYMCGLCNTIFSSQDEIQSHLEQEHNTRFTEEYTMETAPV